MTLHLPLVHPRLTTLSAFAAEELASNKRARVAAHARRCVRCQDALRFVRRMREESGHVLDAMPSDDLFERVMRSRARGERHIVPTPFPNPPRSRATPRRVGVGLGAVAAVALFMVLGRSQNLAAVASASVMRLSPEYPRPGDTIRVTYRPAGNLFPALDSLVLRARLRTADDAIYAEGVPPSRVRRLAMLYRDRGDEFTGVAVLPPGVAYASVVVESPDAAIVDDNGARHWEIVTHAAGGRPTYEALRQRVHEMMGRSWEEGYATAKRLTTLYPERISAWSLREFFERELYGERAADSMRAANGGGLDALIATAKSTRHLSSEDIGTIFFAAAARRARDSTQDARREFEYWWERISREYPRHEHVAAHHATVFSRHDWRHPQMILDSLDRVYARMAPLSGAGLFMATIGAMAARRAGDSISHRKWLERQFAGEADSARRLAFQLAEVAAYRSEGLDGLRALLVGPREQLEPRRGLSVNAAEYERMVDDARRRVLSVIGRGLLADGQMRAGLDTLALAAAGAWNVAIFRALEAGHLRAGDSAAAWDIRVRLAVDPRTHDDTVAAIEREGRARRGVTVWDSLTRAARAEMYAVLRQRSTVTPLRGSPRAADDGGRLRDLRELTGGRPAVVIFWSRYCGAALEALPRIIATATRLHAAGVPVVFVHDQPRTEPVAKYLRDAGWRLPVYYDKAREMSNAFGNFGTPSYYVLDDAGRIRFDHADGEAQLIAQAEALVTDIRGRDTR